MAKKKISTTGVAKKSRVAKKSSAAKRISAKSSVAKKSSALKHVFDRGVAKALVPAKSILTHVDARGRAAMVDVGE